MTKEAAQTGKAVTRRRLSKASHLMWETHTKISSITHRKVSWDYPFLVHSASRNPRGRWDQRRAFGTSFPVSLWCLNIQGPRKYRWKEKGMETAMTLQSSTKGWLLPFTVLLNPECRGWGRAVCSLSTQKLTCLCRYSREDFGIDGPLETRIEGWVRQAEEPGSSL